MNKPLYLSLIVAMSSSMGWAEDPTFSKDFRCVSLASKSDDQQRHLFLELETEVINRHGWNRITESDDYTTAIESACLKSPFSKMGEMIYQYYAAKRT